MKNSFSFKPINLYKRFMKVPDFIFRVKVLSLSGLFLSVLLISCQKDLQTLSRPEIQIGSTLKSSAPVSTPLITAQSVIVGSVSTLYNDAGDQLTITYIITNSNYCLNETHLDVQSDPANFPQTSSGNPKTNKFKYGANLGNATTWIQVVDLTTVSGWSAGNMVYIAANAMVKSIPGGTKESWGQGLLFPGNNWAMYFNCYPPLSVTVTAIPAEIYAGQSSQLNIIASGGTGSYSYSWTSNPIGFSSVSQNPTVMPSGTTTYTCIVTSGNLEETVIALVIVLPTLWQCGDELVDTRDGQSYTTVQIGTQCWMKENLNIGLKLEGSQSLDPNNGTIEKHCYENDENDCSIYGGLYQWDEVMQGAKSQGNMGICPTGWHIPSGQQWNELSTFLGGNEIAGGKMKEPGLSHWESPNNGATNESGFSALASGSDQSIYGPFGYIGKVVRFWSSTYDIGSNWHIVCATLQNVDPKLQLFGWSEHAGYSVRCLKNDGENYPPSTYNRTINGNCVVGQTLTGSYEYSDNENDPEGISLFQWYRASPWPEQLVPIPGANGLMYTLQPEDINFLIRFGVTPMATSGTFAGTENFNMGYVGPVIQE